MEQRKLYRTIDNITRAAPKFNTTEELLVYVLNEINKNEEINIIGGRIWKLNEAMDGYYLIEQFGDVEKIEKNYEQKVADTPSFKEIGRNRTIIARENDTYLRTKGILRYSASGIGEKYKVKTENGIYYLYKYLIAINGRKLDDDFLYTLNIISTTLSSIIRTKKIERKARQNIAELEKASEIQRSILPEHSYSFQNYEIFGISVPEQIVGGDFFDYLTTTDDYTLCVAIGDAASKGISAAAQALYVSGALKMGVGYEVNMTSLMRKISNLVNDTFPYERFVTLFFCELYNDEKGLCVFVNAGHNSPYVYNSKSGVIEELQATGPVLGPAPNQRYNTDSIYINKGDILLLYTDGIVEAANKKFEFFSDARLKECLLKYKDRNPKEICELIIQDVQRFSARGKYSDDKTLVVIKRVK
ncbi:MAG: PP2C family protein-serine/threonine phosphatase [Ignavibacteria bacterium]|jgi:sigma-B regulation protein RsbU (phosphoserine phosphatase)